MFLFGKISRLGAAGTGSLHVFGKKREGWLRRDTDKRETENTEGYNKDNRPTGVGEGGEEKY